MYLKKSTQTSWFRQIALILAIALPLTQLAPYAEAYSPSISDFSSPTLPFSIPAELGYVTQSFQSKNGKFIVHLQDAHGSISAQRQLAEIVKYLHQQFDVELLLLEGAEGELAMDEARRFPDGEIRERIGRKFLEKFELTGPEYYVISDNPKMEVYGLERMKNYYTNREDYLAARRLSQTTLHRVAELEDLFRNIRRETANRELRVFYREEEMSEKTGVFSMSRLISLAKMYQAKPKHLDFKQFFPSLAPILSAEKLLNIKSEKVLEEYAFLESAVKELLIQTPEERKADEWLSKIKLLRKLFALELSSDDHRLFLKNRTDYNEESFKAFLRSAKREKVWKQEYVSIFKLLPVFLRFYEGAHTRDVEMAKKTERWLREKRQKTAIAVTGGFHTAGYTAALREAGFGCLVIQPKLSEIKENDQEKYHRAAERDLSRAFSRSQIVELEPIAGFGSGERYQRLVFDMNREAGVSARSSSGFGSPSDEILRFLEQFTGSVYAEVGYNHQRIIMNQALKTVRDDPGRYFDRFFEWRARTWGMSLERYAEFFQGERRNIYFDKWHEEIWAIARKIWGFHFISGASQTYDIHERELETIRHRWQELLSKKGLQGDKNLRVRIVGVGSKPYELETILDLWVDLRVTEKQLLGWNITFEIYGVDVGEFMMVEELLRKRKFESLREKVELHWMDATDSEQVDGMWGGSPADIVFIRHVLRDFISAYPQLQKVLVRSDVWAPGGLMIVDRGMGRFLVNPKTGVRIMDGRDVDVFNTTWILGNQPVGFGAAETFFVDTISPEISETADSEEIMLAVMEKIQSADKPLRVQLSPKTFKQRAAFLNYGFREIGDTQQEVRRQILELFKNGAIKSVTESSHNAREFTLRTDSGIFVLHASQEMNGNNFRYLKERKGWRVFTSARRPENTADTSALEFVLGHFEIPILVLGIPTKVEKEAVLGALFGAKKETFDAVLLSDEEIREREEERARMRRQGAEKERLEDKKSVGSDLPKEKQPVSMAERVKNIFRPLSERTLIAPTVFLEALNDALGNGRFELRDFSITTEQVERIRDFLWGRAQSGDKKAKEIYELLFQNPSELELVREKFESFAKETFGRFIISEDTVLGSAQEAVETFLEAALIEASFDSKLGERQLAGFTLSFLKDNYQSIYRFLKADDAPTSNDITRFFPLLFPMGLNESEAESAKIFYDVLGVERIQPTGQWHFPHQIITRYSKIDLTGTKGIDELIAYLEKAPQKPVVVLAFDLLIKKFRRQAVGNFKKISERFFSQYKKRLEESGDAAEFRKQYFAAFNLTEKKFAYLTGDESALADAERDAPKVPVQVTRQTDSVEVNWEVKIEKFPVKNIEEFISKLSSVSDAEILRYADLKNETVTIIPWLDGRNKLLGLQDAERYARENHLVLKVGHWFYRFEGNKLIVADKTGTIVGTSNDPNLRMFLLIRVHGIIQYLAKIILQRGQLPDRQLKSGLSPSPVRYRVEFYSDLLIVHFGPSVQAKLNADGEVKGTQQGNPIPESDALKEQVIASGLMALALLRAAKQRNSKDPLLSVPTYEELLEAIPKIFSESQANEAGFGHVQAKLQPLSEEEIVNWWETGFIDRKETPLPPDRRIEGRIAKIPPDRLKEQSGKKYRVIKQRRGYVFRMESKLDPNRGAILTLYQKPANQRGKFFEPSAHYQWLPKWGRPVEINLAAWDLWDFHEGKQVVAVEDRYFEAYIIKQQREGKAEQFSVRATLFTEPSKQKTMTITPHDGFTFDEKDLREPIAIALENDPDHGLVANAYWKKDYEKGIEKRWGKEMGTAVYDQSDHQYRSIDLNRFSVVAVLRGRENIKPGRYFQSKITSINETDRGVIWLEEGMTVTIPSEVMQAQNLKTGDEVFLRVGLDMNHGNYVGIYKSSAHFDKDDPPNALAKIKYLKYRTDQKDSKVKGRTAEVDFPLLDVFAVKDPAKKNSIKPDRGIKINVSKIVFLSKGYARLHLFTAHAAVPRMSFILPLDKKDYIEGVRAQDPEAQFEINVRRDKDYGNYLEVMLKGEFLGNYTVLPGSDNLRLVDFNLIRILDWFHGRTNIHGDAVDIRGAVYSSKNPASALGNIMLKFDNRRLSVQSPNFKKIKPLLVFERDIVYGTIMKVYNAEEDKGKRQVLAIYRKPHKFQKRKKLIPAAELGGAFIERLVRMRAARYPRLLNRNGLTLDDIIEMAIYQVGEREKSSGMDEEKVEIAVNEFMRFVLDYMITRQGADRMAKILRETRLARPGASADDLDAETRITQPAETEKAGFGMEGNAGFAKNLGNPTNANYISTKKLIERLYASAKKKSPAGKEETQDRVAELSSVLMAAAIYGDRELYNLILADIIGDWDRLRSFTMIELAEDTRFYAWLAGQILLAADAMDDKDQVEQQVKYLKEVLPQLDKALPNGDAYVAWARRYYFMNSAADYASFKTERRFLTARDTPDFMDKIWAFILNLVVAANRSDKETYDQIVYNLLRLTNKLSLKEALEYLPDDGPISKAWAVSLVKFAAATIRDIRLFDELDELSKKASKDSKDEYDKMLGSVFSLLAERRQDQNLMSGFGAEKETKQKANEGLEKEINQRIDALLDRAVASLGGISFTQLPIESQQRLINSYFGWDTNEELNTVNKFHLLMGNILNYPTNMPELVQEVLDPSGEVNQFIIPSMRTLGEPLAADLPAADDWMAFQMFREYPKTKLIHLSQRVESLAKLSPRGSALLFAMLGRHLRHFYDIDTDEVDVRTASKLMAGFLPELREYIKQIKSKRSDGIKDDQVENLARRYVAALFGGLMMTTQQNALSSGTFILSRPPQAPFVKDYQHDYFDQWLEELKKGGIDYLGEILKDSAELFSDLLPEDRLPIFVSGARGDAHALHDLALIHQTKEKINKPELALWDIVTAATPDAISYYAEEPLLTKHLDYWREIYAFLRSGAAISAGFGAENKNMFSSEKESVNERLERHNDEDELKKVVRDDVLNVLEKITMSGEAKPDIEIDDSVVLPDILELTRPSDLDEFRDMLGDMDEDDDSTALDSNEEQTLLQVMRGAVEHVRAESFFAAYTVITRVFHPNLEADAKYLQSKDPEAWTAFEYLFRLALGEPLLEEQRRAAAGNAVIDLGLLISRNNALDKLRGVRVLAKRFIEREGAAALSPHTRDIPRIYGYVNMLAKNDPEIFRIFDKHGIYDPVWQKQILDQVLKGGSGFGFVAKQEKTLFVKGTEGLRMIEEDAEKRAFRFAFPRNIRVVLLDDETGDLVQAKKTAIAIGKALRLKREQVWVGSALNLTAEDWLLNREIIYIGEGPINRRFAKNVVENNEGWNAFFEMLLRSEKLLAQAA